MKVELSALWRKEYAALNAHLFIIIMVLLWLTWGIYFLAALEEYQAIATALAKLSAPRGVSDMLLVPVNQFMLWLLALTSIFFAARLLADEFSFGTAQLYQSNYAQWLGVKFVALSVQGILLTLPLWVSLLWLSFGTQLDKGVVLGIFTAQWLMLFYAIGLTFVTVLWLRHALAAALFAILWLVLWWLLPALISSPAALVSMLQWLSPFAHVELLVSGQFALQTLVFVGLQAIFFISLIMLFSDKGE